MLSTTSRDFCVKYQEAHVHFTSVYQLKSAQFCHLGNIVLVLQFYKVLDVFF